MTLRTSLLGGAALGALIAVAFAPAAMAKPAHHHHRAMHAPAAATKSEIDELKAEVEALKAQQDQQSAQQAQTQAQLQQLQGQLSEANARADKAEAQVQAQIETIPGAVQQEVAKQKPKTDKLYYKGVTITLGGFAAAESVYRTKNNVADIGSNFSKIPYNNSVLAHEDETRFTGRQSRISFLAQGNVNPQTQLGFYGEFDFLGAAQTANSNESNSYNLRIRHLYGQADWNDSGWHLLAGQNWSLVTMNSAGITPRNEDIPLTIEAQYVVGFVWARQPQIRLTKDFDDKQLWIAGSIENAQTTFGAAATGTGTSFGGVTTNVANAGIGLLANVNNFSLNHAPDFIGKIAFEPDIGGARPLHVEAFGLAREFYDRVSIAAGSQATQFGLTPGNSTANTWGGGFGGGVTYALVPHLLDVQGSALTGVGIGRYGSGQLPDVIQGPGGELIPIRQTMFLLGGVWHARPSLDIYAYGGDEFQGSKVYNFTVGGKTVALGYGNPAATLGNCFVEGAACSPDTQQMDQYTVGFWDKVYQGSFGSFRVGIQYSHTDLRAFGGVAGANTAGFPTGSFVRPTTSDDMVFTSIRYYPF
jgi:hypothetical protein